MHDHFKPEFLNRIDEIVVFHRLDESHIERIVDIQVEQLRDAARRAQPRPRAHRRRPRAHRARSATTPTSGPRPLKRVIQREVSDPVALALLKGEYHDGDIIVVDATPDGHADLQRQQPVTID